MSSSVDSILAALEGLGPGDEAICIGIVDGIADLSISALAGQRLAAETTMLGTSAGDPDVHGTEVCSLIFGESIGLARGCSGLILPIFFPDARRNQPGRASQMDIARALTIAGLPPRAWVRAVPPAPRRTPSAR